MSKLRSPMDVVAISAYYGMYNPFNTGSTMHYGIDMTGKDSGGGDLILMPHNGYIVASGTDSTDGAKYIVTQHWGVDGVPKGKKMICVYWHLYSISTYVQEYKVKKTPVKMGTVIGKEGGTGKVTGPHLHFGVFIVPETYNFTSTTAMRQYAVNPLDYMYCYADQSLKTDPKNLVKKCADKLSDFNEPEKKIVTVKGELISQNGDIYTIKGGLV